MVSKEKEFREYYNKYFGHIFNYLKQRVPLIEDVEEITLDTFNSLWISWGNLVSQENVKPYLFGICKNKLNDFLRKKYKINGEIVLLDKVLEESLVIQDNLDSDVKNTSKNNKIIERLKTLSQQLGPKEQKVMQLKHEKNLSIAQIASAMGITVTNVKVINNRLLKKLKKLWETQKI